MLPSVEDGSVLLEEEKDEGPRQTFDFSKTKPEDFPCYGTIEPGHPECEACPFKDKCAEKASKV